MSNFALKQRLHFAEYPDGALHLVRFESDWVNALCDADELAAECTFPETLDPVCIAVCRKCVCRLADELEDHQKMLAEALNALI